MQIPSTFSIKAVPLRRWLLIAAVLLALPAVLMVLSPHPWLVLLIFTPLVGLVFWQGRRQLLSTRLTLEEGGFRYSRMGNELWVPWTDIRTLSRTQRGQNVSLRIITRQGRYLVLAGFEQMPEIGGYMESRAKDLEKTPDLRSRLKRNSYSAYAAMALFGIGVWLKLAYPQSDTLFYLGTLIQLAGLLGFLWLAPSNASRVSPVKRYLRLLGIWVLAVLAVLFILYFFDKGGHH